MQLRNLGIVGYVGGVLFVAALLAVLFYPNGAGRGQDDEAWQRKHEV